jgi:transposase
MQQRRKFSREFKLEAVNMVLGRGVSIAQVARDLGVNQNLISRWVRAVQPSNEDKGKHGLLDAKRENLRLQSELASARVEREILKKGRRKLITFIFNVV